ncbi:MAG: hypothetical protein V9G23_18360 [Giesbergeria sp.]
MGAWTAAVDLPRYLDLASYEDSAGVPFTQSSNLLAALDAALQGTDWPMRWRRIQQADAALHEGLQDAGFQIVGIARADARHRDAGHTDGSQLTPAGQVDGASRLPAGWATAATCRRATGCRSA